MNYKFITDFHKSRQAKIGASDIPKLIPHPEKQTESLSAYTDSKGKRHSETAFDLYDEKINGKKWEYSFPAEMGHVLEGQALYEFIKDNIDKDVAFEFLRGYQMHKMEQETQSHKAGKLICINPEPYNQTPFKHNTETVSSYGVAHADCVYDPGGNNGMVVPDSFYESRGLDKSMCGGVTIKKNGLTIDLSKPFIIEAKSARSHTVSARKKDKYKGYDLTLKSWQGIPLKVYFQVQYQMILYNIDMAYVSLIFDTSEKYYWQIKANKKHQRDLIQIAEYMKKCIDNKTPPKQLLMNSKDIASLYPEIKEDFREVKNDELAQILKIATIEKKADQQEKMHAKVKKDAQERMSIHLRDTEVLKGIVNGKLKTITKWKKTGGATGIMGLSDIGKREDSKKLLNYIKRNKLTKTGEVNKKPSVVIKLSELEGE